MPSLHFQRVAARLTVTLAFTMCGSTAGAQRLPFVFTVTTPDAGTHAIAVH